MVWFTGLKMAYVQSHLNYAGIVIRSKRHRTVEAEVSSLLLYSCMELIVFVITVFGFVIAYVTYKNTYIKEPKEDTEFLINQYDYAETATKKLIDELKTYSTLNSCPDEHFKDGLTFKEGVAFLEHACALLFTYENRQSMIMTSIRKKQLDELIKRIDIHRDNIETIQTHLNFYFKKTLRQGTGCLR